MRGPGANTLVRSPARRLLWPLILVALALGTVALHVRAYPLLSPIDEMQHFDHLEKASRGERVRPGDRVGTAAMREEACRGIDAAFVPPPCDTPVLLPEVYQELGYSTSYTQMPAYYALTGVIARGLKGLLSLASLLTAARLVGGLWLAAALLSVDRLLVELSASRAARAIVAVLLTTTPVVLHAHATVNPDATLLPLGTTVVLFLLRAERDRRWLLPAAALIALAVFMEPTTLLALLVAAGYGALRLAGTRGSERSSADFRRAASVGLTAAAMCLGAALAMGATIVVLRNAGGADPGLAVPKNQLFHDQTIGLSQILGEMPSLVTPVQNAYRPPMFRNLAVTLSIQMVDWLVLGALIGGALLSTAERRLRLLSGAVLTVLLIGGPLFATINAQSDFYFSIPSRYGLPVLGVAFAILGRLLDRPVPQLVAGALAALAAAGCYWGLLSPLALQVPT